MRRCRVNAIAYAAEWRWWGAFAAVEFEASKNVLAEEKSRATQ
jgi:hypothetical protein